MRKKTATATEQPKPVEIPNPENNPAVVAVRVRYQELNEQLSAVRTERKNLERDIGTKGGESDEDLEARLLARGQSAEKLIRLRELRRAEQVTDKAVKLVGTELATARDIAKRELTVKVREEVFLPAVRAGVRDWLDAVAKAEKLRRLVDDIQARDVGSGTHCPFNVRVPLTLADHSEFTGFVHELIREGFTDAATINAAFPGLI